MPVCANSPPPGRLCGGWLGGVTTSWPLVGLGEVVADGTEGVGVGVTDGVGVAVGVDSGLGDGAGLGVTDGVGDGAGVGGGFRR